MEVTIDISLYPLTESYIPPIDDLIERLNAHTDVSVVTNTVSTQVTGDYQVVMRILTDELAPSLSGDHRAVVVTKLLRTR